MPGQTDRATVSSPADAPARCYAAAGPKIGPAGPRIRQPVNLFTSSPFQRMGKGRSGKRVKGQGEGDLVKELTWPDFARAELPPALCTPHARRRAVLEKQVPRRNERGGGGIARGRLRALLP